MAKKRLDKKISYLEPSFNDILVCKKNELRPFLEIFVQTPENVAQEGLGAILGIFEITDDSEDSSYIANYLISVVKKEYFSKIKRGPIESFEAALHKANLALAKLAEHETIGWIGNFNAICAVIEKGNVHLSQSGTAKAYLLRGKVLTDISEKEDSLSPPNPLKTFEDVLSGRLEKNDKIIITTESIFDIFSFEEIKRSALKFSREEFIRFLKTALVNELEKAAVLVVDMQEKEEEAEIVSVPKSQEVNAWSQNSFAKSHPPKIESKPTEPDNPKEKVFRDLQEEIKKKDGDYTDNKTGHIYIKENQHLKEKESFSSEYLEASKDKVRSLGAFVLASSKSILSGISSFTKSAFVSLGNAIENFKRKRHLKATNKGEKEETAKELPPVTQESAEKKYSFKNIFLSVKKLPLFQKNIREKQLRIISEETRDRVAAWTKSASSISKNVYETTSSVRKLALPNFSKIKGIIAKLDYQQKLYAILIVILIVVVPYFAIKVENGIREKNQPAATETPTPIIPLEKDRNVIRVENASEVYSGSDILRTVNLKGKILAVKKSEVIDIQNNRTFEIPQDFQEPEIVSPMDDLGLLFLIKGNRTLSFSPASGKFQNNNIVIPENSSIASAETYLTYLYLLDSKNSQIYRYPRAEGGFGEKTNWLKDSIDLSSASSLAINENVFVSDGKNIWKLFRGKKQDFIVEETATPIAVDSLYTKRDSQNLYVLDKDNSRIIKLDANGSILNQYYHSEIVNATDFTVDEKNNMVYFAGNNGMKSFNAN